MRNPRALLTNVRTGGVPQYLYQLPGTPPHARAFLPSFPVPRVERGRGKGQGGGARAREQASDDERRCESRSTRAVWECGVWCLAAGGRCRTGWLGWLSHRWLSGGLPRFCGRAGVYRNHYGLLLFNIIISGNVSWRRGLAGWEEPWERGQGRGRHVVGECFFACLGGGWVLGEGWESGLLGGATLDCGFWELVVFLHVMGEYWRWHRWRVDGVMIRDCGRVVEGAFADSD